MASAAQPFKQNSEYLLIGAMQNVNPQFWGATYVPYESVSRLYPNMPLRPSFYDEGCFSTQCDLQTMNVCTKIPGIQGALVPNWNSSLNELYTSRDTFGGSAQARAFSMMHSNFVNSTQVPMSGL
jgi:hypothetical protein